MTQQEKLAQAKATLGKTYLLHPSNRVKRKKPFRATVKSLRARLGSGVDHNLCM